MTKKLLILTSDPTALDWRSLEDKKQHILNALNRTRNAVWQVEIKYRPLVPELTAQGRVTHKWFNSISFPYFREGYQHVCLHWSMAQWDAHGIIPTIRGSNLNDTNFVGEMYVRADETTIRNNVRLRPRELYTQFVQTILHELSHELARSTGVPDDTHAYHDANPDISGIFDRYDMSKWQPVYQEGMVKIGLLQQILELTKKLISLK